MIERARTTSKLLNMTMTKSSNLAMGKNSKYSKLIIIMHLSVDDAVHDTPLKTQLLSSLMMNAKLVSFGCLLAASDGHIATTTNTPTSGHLWLTKCRYYIFSHARHVKRTSTRQPSDKNVE